jgi:hypothetical protein
MTPEFTRKKLNLAFVEDPLLATAAANVTSPTQTTVEAFPDDTTPTEAQPLPMSYPSSAAHSRFPSLASDPLTPPADRDTRFGLPLKIPPPADSAVGDLDLDRFDEIQVEQQEADIKTPHLVTHCKVYAIAEK